MATEEKKSIEISYKANIKDLVSKLEQIPNVTKEEAKKMVAALDRQLKQAEKAAAKSAAAQKKVAKEMANAAKRGARDFDDLADSAAHAGQRMEMVAEKSGDIDRGFSGVGLALRGVNPQLAEAADGMADTFAVVESLIMGFGALNPLLLAGAAVVGGLAFAYSEYTESVEEAKKRTEEIKQEITALNEKIKEQQQIIAGADVEFGNFTAAVNESALEVALLRGELSELDAATMRAEASANNFSKSQLATLDQQQTALNESRQARIDEIALLNEQIRPLKEARKIQQSLSETIAGTPQRFKEATFEEQQLQKNLEIARKQLKEDEARLSTLSDQTQTIRKQTAQLEANLVQAAQLREQERKQEEAAKRRAEYREREKKRIEEIDKQLDEQAKAELASIRARDELRKMHQMASFSDLDKEIQKVEDRYAKEYENLLKLGVISGEQELAQTVAHDLDKQRLAEIAELRVKQAEKEEEEKKKADELAEELHNKQIDRINEQVNKYTAMGSAFTGSIKTFAGAVGEYLENTDRATEKSVKRLFRLEQAAAVADIAMETAKAIAGSLGLPPGVRGVTIAAITASGAAQTAAVLSQQPPTLHMGGMAPDETNATLLTGEAVLDRTTVRNIGGQEGIRQLQNGQTGTNNVVIIQPFKHIDRYNRSARRVAGRVHAGAY